MEHESFEDVEIANLMNENFISIKVDREQRPDIDSIYMTVVQSMTGHGGWPMTVWLTPDREPFYGGTYFPARDGDREGHPGFLQMLQRLSDLYRQHSQEIKTKAKEIAQQIKSHIQHDQSGEVATQECFHLAFKQFDHSFDSGNGGFGFAPKFPRPSVLEFLFHYGKRTGNVKATEMATFTLKSMLYGGIFDQIAGGFHRYSVDANWVVPHFEKMLYDQSQMVLSMIHAYQITKDPEFRRGIVETLDYVKREMTDQEGGFYSATDADSEGVEGKYFVWTPEEVLATLGVDAQLFMEYYGVSKSGNFEEKNILFIGESVMEFAKRKGMDMNETSQRIQRCKEKLRQKRTMRIPPLTDDKVIVAWNGLMISAFARAGFVFNQDHYLDIARKSAEYILNKLVVDGELFRSSRNGKTNTKAFLDDYACLIYGLLELFEATGEGKWIKQALHFQNQMIQKFWDHGTGGFYSSEENQFFAREKPFYDGAEPSGNSMGAWNLLRISTIMKDESYRDYAKKIFQTFAQILQSNPAYMPQMLTSLDYYLSTAKEVVLVDAHDGRFDALKNVIASNYFPNRVFIQISKDQPHCIDTKIPSLEDKQNVQSSTGFVCEGYICLAPAHDPQAFLNQLNASS